MCLQPLAGREENINREYEHAKINEPRWWVGWKLLTCCGKKIQYRAEKIEIAKAIAYFSSP